jgi:hypothetical protein
MASPGAIAAAGGGPAPASAGIATATAATIDPVATLLEAASGSAASAAATRKITVRYTAVNGGHKIEFDDASEEDIMNYCVTHKEELAHFRATESAAAACMWTTAQLRSRFRILEDGRGVNIGPLKPGPPCYIHPEAQKAIADLARSKAEAARPMLKKQFEVLVMDVAQAGGAHLPGADHTKLVRLLKGRTGLVNRDTTAVELTRVLAADAERDKKWHFGALEAGMKHVGYDPDRMNNLDEIAIGGTNPKTKGVVPKEMRTARQVTSMNVEHDRVATAVPVSKPPGAKTPPPSAVIIMHGAEDRKPTAEEQAAYQPGGKPGRIFFNPTAYMSCKVWHGVLDHILANTEGKQLILTDQESHRFDTEELARCTERDVCVVAIPSHSSGWKQPLDASGNKEFKEATAVLVRERDAQMVAAGGITNVEYLRCIAAGWEKVVTNKHWHDGLLVTAFEAGWQIAGVWPPGKPVDDSARHYKEGAALHTLLNEADAAAKLAGLAVGPVESAKTAQLNKVWEEAATMKEVELKDVITRNEKKKPARADKFRPFRGGAVLTSPQAIKYLNAVEKMDVAAVDAAAEEKAKRAAAAVARAAVTCADRKAKIVKAKARLATLTPGAEAATKASDAIATQERKLEELTAKLVVARTAAQAVGVDCEKTEKDALVAPKENAKAPATKETPAEAAGAAAPAAVVPPKAGEKRKRQAPAAAGAGATDAGDDSEDEEMDPGEEEEEEKEEEEGGAVKVPRTTLADREEKKPILGAEKNVLSMFAGYQDAVATSGLDSKRVKKREETLLTYIGDIITQLTTNKDTDGAALWSAKESSLKALIKDKKAGEIAVLDMKVR